MARLLAAFCALCVAAVFCLAQAGPDRIARADRLKMRETRDTMNILATDLRTYRDLQREYPATLQDLVTKNMREAVPKDAWGRDFSYARSKESGFRLTSHGADGKEGGEGAGRDIVWGSAGELRELSAEEKDELERSREAARAEACLVVARREMAVVGSAVVKHRAKNGAWPSSLNDLRTPPTTDEERAKDWCFTDPWARSYGYKALDHDNFAVICLGADGKEGGAGADADFVVTELEVRLHGNNDDEEIRWRGGWGGRTQGYDWQVGDLAQGVLKYKEAKGKLPATLEDLLAPDATRNGPVRRELPRTRFGHEYVYLPFADGEFYVVSLGKDGLAGGIEDDSDAISPEPGTTLRPYRDWEEEARPAINVNAELVVVAEEQARDIAAKVQAQKDKGGAYPEALDAIKAEFPGEVIPADPWGNAFQYTLRKDEAGAATGFAVKCLGSDGQEGGDDHAVDFWYDETLTRQPKAPE